MGKAIDSLFLSQIGDQFEKMAHSVNDVRKAKKQQELINDQEFKKLGKEANVLLDHAAKMKVLSTIWVGDETATALENIKNLHEDIEKATEGWNNIQKAVLLIGNLASLGQAIISKNPSGIQSALQEFYAAKG